jgi:hypothetical protein
MPWLYNHNPERMNHSHEVTIVSPFVTKREWSQIYEWCVQNHYQDEWHIIPGGFAFDSHEHATIFLLTWN